MNRGKGVHTDGAASLELTGRSNVVDIEMYCFNYVRKTVTVYLLFGLSRGPGFTGCFNFTKRCRACAMFVLIVEVNASIWIKVFDVVIELLVSLLTVRMSTRFVCTQQVGFVDGSHVLYRDVLRYRLSD